MDRAYGHVDQERWRFTVDSRRRAAKSSPKQALAGATGTGCSPRVVEKVEDALGFLTKVFPGRCDNEVTPTAVNQGNDTLELDGEASRLLMEGVE
jgi:hypothetical protein